MTTQVEVKLECPKCGTAGDIHQIIYGMPAPDFDFEKYEVGGCMVLGEMPKWMCRNCGWEGVRKPRKKSSSPSDRREGLGKFYAARATSALKRDRANGYHWGYLTGDGKTFCTCGLVLEHSQIESLDDLVVPEPGLDLTVILRMRGHHLLPSGKGLAVALIYEHAYTNKGRDQFASAYCQTCGARVEYEELAQAQEFATDHNESCLP